jgi:outer membrane protein assembly factor BamB
MMDAKLWLIPIAAICLGACTGGGGPSCSFSGSTTLAATTWPKFRADSANSGRAEVDLTQSTGNGITLFDGRCSVSMQQTCTVSTNTPPCPTGQTCMPIGPNAATPVLGADNVFLGSSDANVYVWSISSQQSVTLPTQIKVQNAITGTPLLGANGNLFVPSNTELTQFFADGGIRSSTTLVGFVSASPNIWDGDGTTFIGTQSGSFEGICPNGVSRFTSSFPATQSTAALVQDPNVTDKETPIIIGGGANGQVRAYTLRGRQYWSFFASANIVAAILIDASTDIFYVADISGRVHAGNVANGQIVSQFGFAAPTGITASPALGRDTAAVPTLYVVDQRGTLYALDRATGAVRWTYHPADDELPMAGDALSVSSSPAVATGGDTDVIVFAADVVQVLDPTKGPVAIGGRVYAVRDDGDHGTEFWFSDEDGLPGFNADHSIGTSSPAIAAPATDAPTGTNGTVYIGRQGARLVVPTEPDQNPYVVNDGGALYAIAP